MRLSRLSRLVAPLFAAPNRENQRKRKTQCVNRYKREPNVGDQQPLSAGPWINLKMLLFHVTAFAKASREISEKMNCAAQLNNASHCSDKKKKVNQRN